MRGRFAAGLFLFWFLLGDVRGFEQMIQGLVIAQLDVEGLAHVYSGSALWASTTGAPLSGRWIRLYSATRLLPTNTSA